jgi:prepilin-type N-terminal cleavage/methylation domain-containing protein
MQGCPSQRGFSLVEVMIAIAIMTISLVALIAVFGTAIGSTKSAQEDLIARQKALEAMESIYTARNTQQIVFAQIANFPTGIFTAGTTRPAPMVWWVQQTIYLIRRTGSARPDPSASFSPVPMASSELPMTCR